MYDGTSRDFRRQFEERAQNFPLLLKFGEATILSCPYKPLCACSPGGTPCLPFRFSTFLPTLQGQVQMPTYE